eukprot:m51a1_g9973 hypothetical protein (121) ;mRNA; f:107933-108693
MEQTPLDSLACLSMGPAFQSRSAPCLTVFCLRDPKNVQDAKENVPNTPDLSESQCMRGVLALERESRRVSADILRELDKRRGELDELMARVRVLKAQCSPPPVRASQARTLSTRIQPKAH